MKFDIVVILVNYNNFTDTTDCINSIFQTRDEQIFVIIVDNNSSDKEPIQYFDIYYPNIKVIQNEENVGFGKANNIGIEWANQNIDFKYLLLLNNDTLINSNTIPLLKYAFNEDNNIGIVTGRIMYESNPEIVWYGGGFINKKRGWPRIVDYNKQISGNTSRASKLVTFISGCTMMFTKDSITKLNGFDEDFFMYCEDIELSLRAIKMGYSLYYEADAVVYHKVQGSFNNDSHEKSGLNWRNPNLVFLFYHMKSNQWISMKKHLTKKEFLFFNLFYFPELIYKTVRYILHGRFDMLRVFFKIMQRISQYHHNSSNTII